MSMVIVDYDVGNLRSVQKALERVGASAQISRDPLAVARAPSLVLPGVGAFPECMGNLKKFGLLDAVKDFIGGGRPFLGICVGYQLLFDESEEFGHSEGLGIFKGKCVKFRPPSNGGYKVPHMGWNQVRYKKRGRLFDGTPENSDFYFVHSYYPVPEEDIVVTETEYIHTFASSVERDNIFATQFHPEKSQGVGLKVLENFAKIAR